MDSKEAMGPIKQSGVRLETTASYFKQQAESMRQLRIYVLDQVDSGDVRYTINDVADILFVQRRCEDLATRFKNRLT